MTLGAECPRCPAPVTVVDGTWRCRDHGSITPLWRARTSDYASFAEHVARAGGMPTYAPWPLALGWTVTDFGCVAADGKDGQASFVTCAGPADLEATASLTVVSEEPGIGLGARCAGTWRTDPGADIGEVPPLGRARIHNRPVSLWLVTVDDPDRWFDRSVFAGEAEGRWLWLVLRPADVALVTEEWLLADLADLGPELIDVPFGDGPRAW
jgi:hypothetical protein